MYGDISYNPLSYTSLLVKVRIKWYCHSKSGSTCELWQLPHAADVPIRGTISEMCSLQFCDIGRGKYKILFSIKPSIFHVAINDEPVFRHLIKFCSSNTKLPEFNPTSTVTVSLFILEHSTEDIEL